MSEYIEREAFIADKKWLHCTDCDKRKGKKRGKLVTLYEIGEAPCKSCGIHDMLEEVECYPAADVRPVVRGKWIEHGEPNERGDYEPWYWKCSICGAIAGHGEYNYCPNCGAKMEGSDG